jgi:nucleoside-diphosphate-sugar epimerase
MTSWLTGAVAITGADGHVGRHLQERLRELPNEVRPLAREDDLAGTLRDADAVVHLAGTLAPRDGNTYESANVETVRRIVVALEGSAVRRLVFLSYPGADPSSANHYLRTKGEAEQLALGCGREAVVVRSTFIYGPPDDPGPSAAPFISVRGKPVSVIGSGQQRYAPTYVGDVVEALARFALDPTTPQGTFALAGPDTLTVDAFADALNGADARERHLGRRVARVLAHVVPALTPAMVDVLAADSLPDGSPLAADVLALDLTRLADHYPYAAQHEGG